MGESEKYFRERLAIARLLVDLVANYHILAGLKGIDGDEEKVKKYNLRLSECLSDAIEELKSIP